MLNSVSANRGLAQPDPFSLFPILFGLLPPAQPLFVRGN